IIAFMPDTWLKKAKAIAKKIGNLFFFVNNWSVLPEIFSSISLFFMLSNTARQVLGLMIFKIRFASSTLFLFRNNHLGLSGTNFNNIKNNKEGNACTPSIQRHDASLAPIK